MFQTSYNFNIINYISRNKPNLLKHAVLVNRNLLNTRTITGKTLLHLATNLNRIDIVKILVNEFNVKDDVSDLDGKTALMIACEKGLYHIVRLLTNNDNINVKDKHNMNAILYAYYSPDVLKMRIVRFLLSKGADYTVVSNNGKKIPENIILLNISPIQTIRPQKPQIIEKEKIIYKPEIPTHILNKYIDMLIDLKEICDICCNEYEKNKVVVTRCNHFLCIKCYENVNLCPYCRDTL